MTITVDNGLRKRLRSQFPALNGDTIFLENAGGSQVPATVANRIRNYMLESYVQLGAGYDLSQRATAVVHIADLPIDELDHQLNESLTARRHAAGHSGSLAPKPEQNQAAGDH